MKSCAIGKSHAVTSSRQSVSFLLPGQRPENSPVPSGQGDTALCPLRESLIPLCTLGADALISNNKEASISPLPAPTPELVGGGQE